MTVKSLSISQVLFVEHFIYLFFILITQASLCFGMVAVISTVMLACIKNVYLRFLDNCLSFTALNYARRF